MLGLVCPDGVVVMAEVAPAIMLLLVIAIPVGALLIDDAQKKGKRRD